MQKKEAMSKFQKTNKILDLLQNEAKKRPLEEKSKNKQRRYWAWNSPVKAFELMWWMDIFPHS